jgi:hypothetical protein
MAPAHLSVRRGNELIYVHDFDLAKEYLFGAQRAPLQPEVAGAVSSALLDMRSLASAASECVVKNLPDVMFHLRRRNASPRLLRRVRAIGEVADFFRHSDPGSVQGLVKEVAHALAEPLRPTLSASPGSATGGPNTQDNFSVNTTEYCASSTEEDADLAPSIDDIVDDATVPKPSGPLGLATEQAPAKKSANSDDSSVDIFTPEGAGGNASTQKKMDALAEVIRACSKAKT